MLHGTCNEILVLKKSLQTIYLTSREKNRQYCGLKPDFEHVLENVCKIQGLVLLEYFFFKSDPPHPIFSSFMGTSENNIQFVIQIFIFR